MIKYFSIRRATLADLKTILELFKNTVQYVCQNDYIKAQIVAWTSSVKNRARWIEAIKEQFFIVAEKKDTIIGLASLDNGNYIDFLYVHKDHQYKGVSSLLFDILQDEAQRQGETILSSHVSKTARPFFERKGFKVIQENHKEIKSIKIMNYWMTNV